MFLSWRLRDSSSYFVTMNKWKGGIRLDKVGYGNWDRDSAIVKSFNIIKETFIE